MNCYAVLLQISICSVIVSEFAVCAKHFTDRWAVQILGGEAEAIKVAHEYGFTYVGEIMPDYYQLVHRKVAKRSVFPSTYYHSDLAKHPKVIWLEQQVAKKRVKRALRFNDPKWPQMWYLNRGRGIDMNVREAWMKGYTGKGVVVTILDDGIETDHPDLRKNFDEQASYDVNSQDPDPQPRYDYSDENRHGTRCAGEVAAEADNNFCSVGVAYDANIGGVRMLDGDVTDSVEAQSLGLNRQHIHIYSASWGPEDDGRTVDGPATLARKAFYDGITKGRGGLGSIFIWASGNGGPDKDSCNCDGYTNNIYTLSISSATENGNIPWYSEACSSTLATTYSSGSGGEKQIMTTDLHQGCTDQHTGTSASAPLAAGLCALALQANPLLTWRDMQHIVVMTAKPNKLIANDWVTTGVNRKVSHSFGYGLMDAAEMVRVARNWTTVPAQNTCEVRSHDRDRIPMNGKITVPLYVDGCEGSQNYVKYLEHVVAKITLKSSRRGDLQIYLTSPMGTKSTLLARRLHDTSTEGFNNWSFMTTHNWGEFARGTWILEIENGAILYTAELQEWSLVVYGTDRHPLRASRSTDASSSSSSHHAIAASLGGGNLYLNRQSFPNHQYYEPAHQQYPMSHYQHRHHYHHNRLHEKPNPSHVFSGPHPDMFTPSSTTTSASHQGYNHDHLIHTPSTLTSPKPNNKHLPAVKMAQVQPTPPSRSSSSKSNTEPKSYHHNRWRSYYPKYWRPSSLVLNTRHKSRIKLLKQCIYETVSLRDNTSTMHYRSARVRHKNPRSAEIREWTLVVMGTGEHPQARSHSEVPMVPRNSNQLPLCSGTTVTGLCIECSSGFYKMANKCVKECPIGWYGKMSEATSKSDSIVITPIKTSSNISLSLKAHFECGVCNAACESCRGAEDTDCFRCKDGYKMFEKKCTVEGFDLLGRHKYVLAAIVVGSVALVVFIAVCFIIQIRNRRSCRFLPHAEAGYKGKYRTLSSPGDQEAGDDSDDEICNKTELVA